MKGLETNACKNERGKINNRNRSIYIAVIVLIALLLFFLFLCPRCLISEAIGVNGHFHRVQGTVKEITGEYILIEPTGRSSIRFIGKEVRLMLPTVSTKGVPVKLLSCSTT